MGCGASKTNGGLGQAPALLAPHLRRVFVEKEGGPSFESLFGSNGRTLLGGFPRKHPYQVILSFPGKQFDFEFTDMDGISVGSGFELAMWFHDWVTAELLGGRKEAALRRYYLDWLGLQYVPGTTKMHNYHGGGKIAYLNDNWKLYYQEAMAEVRVIVVFVTKQWVDSPFCRGEFEHVEEIVAGMSQKQLEEREMLFIVLEDCSSLPSWKYFQDKCNEWEAQVLHYYEGHSREVKAEVESHVLNTIQRCTKKCPVDDTPLSTMIEKEDQWSG